MLLLIAFIGGMVFEHFVFHKIEDKIKEMLKNVIPR